MPRNDRHFVDVQTTVTRIGPDMRHQLKEVNVFGNLHFLPRSGLSLFDDALGKILVSAAELMELGLSRGVFWQAHHESHVWPGAMHIDGELGFFESFNIFKNQRRHRFSKPFIGSGCSGSDVGLRQYRLDDFQKLVVFFKKSQEAPKVFGTHIRFTL